MVWPKEAGGHGLLCGSCGGHGCMRVFGCRGRMEATKLSGSYGQWVAWVVVAGGQVQVHCLIHQAGCSQLCFQRVT